MTRFRNILLTIFSIFLSNIPVHAESLEEKINTAVSPIADAVSGVLFYSISIQNVSIPLILIWLMSGAVFFTLYLKFINIRGFYTAIKITKGDYDKAESKGEVSHFQALATALSGTVGLGNIAGVAVAIHTGGPGATFWMIVAGLLGMSSKLAECTLGVKYRDILEDGSVAGGPIYFLKKGFASKNFPGVGKAAAFLFAVFCIGGALGGGNMFQSNQATEQLLSSFSIDVANPKLIVGTVLALSVGLVIIGGIKSIANVTDKIVPIMCGIYIVAVLYLCALHAAVLPSAISSILTGAFTPEAGYGGLLGVLVQGFRRAGFSNEAGIGSASIAHSAVKTDEPASEGLVALLEPFIDTVIICTMTALAIIVTGTYSAEGMNGVQITALAFSKAGPWFPFLLTIVVVLFAYSTMISWSYYGLISWKYLFGQSRWSDISFKFLFCLIIIAGAVTNLSSVINFSDAMLFAMSIPNIAGMYLLAPEVKNEVENYLLKHK